MHKINDKITTFLPWESIEVEAQQQIINTSQVPCLFYHVAVMPDCHFGKGATVGTVLATERAVIPAAVGVDIGCGMIAVKTDIKRHEVKNLDEIRKGIERRIPMSAGKFNHTIQPSAQVRITELEELAKGEDLDKKFGTNNWREQLGTLGGGNHFIQLCVDENDDIWATLHSGSRGIGNKIGMYYIRIATELMKKWHITLPDPDLSYLPEGTPEFDDYIHYMTWAQRFAMLNREEMMERFLTELKYSGREFKEVERINSHHNFTQRENHFNQNIWVTRKGAVKADTMDRGMIPGSMGTRSYIISGLGNKMSFNSSPHGAGRKMSRTKAQKQFTMADLEKAMEGIEYRKSEVLIDEIPGAYKDIDEVMENAKELVKIDYTLKQILNCKGD